MQGTIKLYLKGAHYYKMYLKYILQNIKAVVERPVRAKLVTYSLPIKPIFFQTK